MAAAASHWSRIQERGSMWGLRLTVGCYRRFGHYLSLPLVLGVVGYFFLTDTRGRAASRAYLERVHAVLAERGQPDWAPGLRKVFAHYRAFALSIADRVALWGGRQDTFRFEFHGREHFDRLRARGRGAILLGAHLGSFDALRVLSSMDGVPVNVLMYTRHAPKINQIFRELSPDAEMRVISADPESAGTALEIKACIERGEFVAVLADRVEPNDRHRVCEIPFLGEPAPFPEAPFLLPVILGSPALMIVALRRGRGRYEVFAEPLCDAARRVSGPERETRARELASAYVRRLEQHCTEAPEQWFNFYDFWSGSPSA